MALSGTNVIFPMAASAAGMSETWLDRHSQSIWNGSPETLVREVAYTQSIFGGVGLGWNGNTTYSTLFLIDAGFSLGDANRIPSGSIITEISAQVQIAESVMNPDLDVTVDASLVKRDGKWNNSVSGIGYSTLTRTQAVGLGNVPAEAGGRAMLRIRDLGGATPNRVLNVKNNVSEGIWYWLAWARFPIADNGTARLDGYGDTFDSTYTGTIGQLAMRFRRKTGGQSGNYRFELWSTVSGTNDPDQQLAFTSEAALSDITTDVNGATYGLDIVSPASGWEIVSGMRYHVRVTTINTSDPANQANNFRYPLIGVKATGEVTSGINGCTGSGESYVWGNKHWLSHGSYGHRAQWPSLYWENPARVMNPDVEPVGGFGAVASGLSGATLAPTLADEWGAWVGLSGNYNPMLSAMQAWIDDPDYVTSGDQAILAFQLSARYFGGNSTTAVSGIRLFISWEELEAPPLDRDWFDGRGVQDWADARGSQGWNDGRSAQDWHNARSAQDWANARTARDWFVREEE